ncbi:hypothetical protein [Paenibacillus wynnii]|uniref:Uncharacterized protein n=1 Tax=Paenibacillus wynnii TaxID=268407 RepID=A0A098MAI3_9BACL|nr:hypothetical protein [Paenibacillus wynnii]KGE18547.1 hypothetical protein PWYN_03575 [Paenibacillus wynnii]
MAYCDYCHEGIGPKNSYEILIHDLGVFGTHEYCIEKMRNRLEQINNKKTLDYNQGHNRY